MMPGMSSMARAVGGCQISRMSRLAAWVEARKEGLAGGDGAYRDGTQDPCNWIVRELRG